ncbi:FxsA family protein [Rhodococcus phenolicus]|uniref:FxsA family protein n=1 Tax=Rhodococcus phenolicus TaxID=263849 RepID=UPI00082C3E2A|nr:FxsA family protein [Rhodococcus phenolicus]
MLPLLFLVYVVAEIAVLAALGSAIGAGYTVLLFLGVSVLGYLILGAQGRRALQNLGKVRAGASPDRALTDGALVGLGAGLVLVPGLLTSVLGILLLLPPTRALLRPVVKVVAARKVADLAARGSWHGERITVVDGQVVEHTVVDANPRLTSAPILEGEIVDTPQRPQRP